MPMNDLMSSDEPFGDLASYRLWIQDRAELRFGGEPAWMRMMRLGLWDCVHEFLSSNQQPSSLNERDGNGQGWCHLYVVNDTSGDNVRCFSAGLRQLDTSWSLADHDGRTPMDLSPSMTLAHEMAVRLWVDGGGRVDKSLMSHLEQSALAAGRPDLARVWAFWGLG